MFPEGFCQKHTISLLVSLIPCAAYPKPIINSSATRQPSRLSAKAQRPPSGLPSVFPEAKLVSIKPSALDQLPVSNCQQEELPPAALKSPVSLSNRVLMAENILLEEQGATTQHITSLSDPILREPDSGPAPTLHTPALEATEASADTMNSSPATPPLCLLSGRLYLPTLAVVIAGGCVQTPSISFKCPSHHLGKVSQHEKD